MKYILVTCIREHTIYLWHSIVINNIEFLCHKIIIIHFTYSTFIDCLIFFFFPLLSNSLSFPPSYSLFVFVSWKCYSGPCACYVGMRSQIYLSSLTTWFLNLEHSWTNNSNNKKSQWHMEFTISFSTSQESQHCTHKVNIGVLPLLKIHTIFKFYSFSTNIPLSDLGSNPLWHIALDHWIVLVLHSMWQITFLVFPCFWTYEAYWTGSFEGWVLVEVATCTFMSRMGLWFLWKKNHRGKNFPAFPQQDSQGTWPWQGSPLMMLTLMAWLSYYQVSSEPNHCLCCLMYCCCELLSSAYFPEESSTS